jgi:hypothetical protein
MLDVGGARCLCLDARRELGITRLGYEGVQMELGTLEWLDVGREFGVKEFDFRREFGVKEFGFRRELGVQVLKSLILEGSLVLKSLVLEGS